MEFQRYRLIRGHCLHVLKGLPDESIDSFVTDPPYGIELQLGTSKRRMSIAGDGKLEARKLWEQWVPEAYRIARNDTAHLVFGTWKSAWMHDVLARHFEVKGCIAWNKRLFGLGHYLRPQWEMIYLCVKGKPPRHGPAPGDVWDELRIIRTQHPCEKPVKLLRRAVRLVAPAASLICDPFAGIASTGVAAIAEGCRFIGCEIDKRHCELGRQRLRRAVQELHGDGA